MGYAFAPVALQLLIFIPAIDQPIGIIALGATLFLSAHAVRVSTIASPGQAFLATLPEARKRVLARHYKKSDPGKKISRRQSRGQREK